MPTGALTVNGILSANGYSGTNVGSGGGAGGSLWLTVRTLGGNGIISANGGSGQLPLGGGGGGGRIAISAQSFSNTFGGIINAYGGAGYVPGGAGTILTNGALQTSQLTLDNGGMRGAPSTITETGDGMNVTIRNGAAVAAGEGFAAYNLLVGSNGTISGTNGLTTTLTIRGNATIQPGGSIILDGDGLGATGKGSGGRSLSSYGYYTGSGGGYGGNGGNGESGASGGAAFGSLTPPNAAGCGGGVGDGNVAASAFGGGVLQMTVGQTLEIDGLISANGAVPTNEAGGGGSGGSIWLSAGTIAGAGRISANGGAGDLPDGGGGGGGRIALSCTSNQYSGAITAYGGRGFVAGGAGTIYVAPAMTNSSPLVIVDNGGTSGAETPVVFPEFLAPNALTPGLTVSGSAILVPENLAGVAGPVVLKNLLVESNAEVTQLSASGNVNLAVFGNATVASNAEIVVDGTGYNPGMPGAGAGTASPNSGEGSGGGYGGAGGASAGGAIGGGTYGSSTQPTNWGSAGGVLSSDYTNFSQGGGVIELNVGGTLSVNGKVGANGSAGIFPGAGGGAGGSIWLMAGALAGGGTISANGGAGQDALGGGGGGGRISISTLTNGFAGGVTAAGGSGFAAGHSGTVYYSTNLAGPSVIAQTPSGAVTGFVSSVLLTFESTINSASVSVTNLTITTPTGPVLALDESYELTGGNEMQINFPQETAIGTYTVEVANIQDILGIPMASPYVGTFSIVAPAVSLAVGAGTQGSNFNLLWNGAQGANYQVESSTDLVNWTPVGPVMAGSNGVNSVALAIGADPGTFFRLVPAN
jgi:hypothetical protein